MCHRDEADSRARGQGGLDATGRWAALAAAVLPGPLQPSVPCSGGPRELRPRRDVPPRTSTPGTPHGEQIGISKEHDISQKHRSRRGRSQSYQLSLCAASGPELAGGGRGRVPRSVPICPPPCLGSRVPRPHGPRAASSHMRRLALTDDGPGRSPTGTASPVRGTAPVSGCPCPMPCLPAPSRSRTALPTTTPGPCRTVPRPPGGWAPSQDFVPACLAGRSCHQHSPVSSSTPGLAPQ